MQQDILVVIAFYDGHTKYILLKNVLVQTTFYSDIEMWSCACTFQEPIIGSHRSSFLSKESVSLYHHMSRTITNYLDIRALYIYMYIYIYTYATAIYMLHDKEIKRKINCISLVSSQMYFHKMLFPFFLSQKFFLD